VPAGEFELIDQLIARIGARPSGGLLLPAGDDAAVIRHKDPLAVSTDMFIENVHFKRAWQSPGDIGYKALAVNLSDMAAMGAWPLYFLLNLALDREPDEEFIQHMAQGMADAARPYAVPLIGGDVSRARELVLAITIIGRVIARPLTRSGAQAGDFICTTGPLGAAAAGMELLDNPGVPQNVLQPLKERLLRPLARVHQGRTLARQSHATAVIDISDGLTADLLHILSASGTGAELYKDRIPVHGAIAKAASWLRRPPLHYALYGGEDYELLFCAKINDDKPGPCLYDDLLKQQYPCYVIGRVIEEPRRIYLVEGGSRTRLRPGGFRHF